MQNEFELAKMKQRGENERALFDAHTSREYKLGQLKENLITSHQKVTPKFGDPE
jgi:hypothetical protein